jgi:putative Mg2+ transporter-C (MgtC) family protein
VITGPTAPFWSSNGQEALLWPALLALVLSALIGIEREVRAKSAGLRTHTLVGVGAALFVLVSKFGFSDVIGNQVSLDPSRVAAQVVSGIGFVGGGLIFVRRDIVRGLTTAASVWLVAAVGMAAGAGLVLVSVVATAGHFVITQGYLPLQRLAIRLRRGPEQITLVYREGRGVLRRALQVCTDSGFTVTAVRVGREDEEEREERIVVVALGVRGQAPLRQLVDALAQIDGVVHASAGHPEEVIE